LARRRTVTRLPWIQSVFRLEAKKGPENPL